MTSPRHDDEMDRLLRRAAPGAPTAECPDAETLAAWRDTGLTKQESAAVESHVADCTRCQMQLAAVARMEPARADTPKRTLRVWPWLVPITATVATAGLWLLVQAPPTAPAPPTAAQPPIASQPQNPAPPHVQSETRVPPEKDARATDRLADTSSRRPEERLSPRARRDESAPSPSAAPPAAGTFEARSRDAAEGARSLEESVAARQDLGRVEDLGRARVARSADGAVTWDKPAAGLLAQVTAGASPTPSVIWLVGRGGLVLLSESEGVWRRLPFPEAIDLTSVRATSAAEAAVTTADGRTFATADAGRTWVQR